MVFNRTEEQERAYLRQIIGALKAAIGNADVSVREQVQTLQEHKDYLWQNRDIDPQEQRSMRENILNTLAVGESVIGKRERLGRMLDIPYFGRIDFREDRGGAVVQPIYIGVHTYYDFDAKTGLIYDWRAPISSMYYDYELGEAYYTSPAGTVEGEISLKRQYRIRKGELEYMIESSVTVHDDILQKELSANADEKMKSIVSTIQREQNRIIRNDDAAVLIIQGVAGSGKTSIALHRVAYLLYAHKDTLSSKDILIISPNKVFADYISNVLPELGEESVPETGMEELLSGVLDKKYKYQTFFEQVGELLEKPAAGFAERIRFKSTPDFASRLDSFLLYVENTYFRAVDVKVRFFPIPGDYIAEQFRRFHRYPMRNRFEAMTDYIIGELEVQYGMILAKTDRTLLRNAIRAMFSGNNDIQLYKEFYEWMGHPEMFKMRKGRMLEYSDLAPLAYLRIALDGLKPYSGVKHLLVDEMQDYTPVQYKVIRRLFPCRKTILGDAGQSVNPYGSSTAEMIRDAFADGEVMKLCKSYRSTCEITDLAQSIRANDELETVSRHGAVPEVLSFVDEEAEIAGVAALIAGFRGSEYRSLGIICKSETRAAALADKLKTYGNDIYFLSNQSPAFVKGIIITSAHMAKGLEFDAVIVPQADHKNYRTEMDRGMLYVAVTRAMHRLTLTHTGKKTGFLNG